MNSRSDFIMRNLCWRTMKTTACSSASLMEPDSFLHCSPAKPIRVPCWQIKTFYSGQLCLSARHVLNSITKLLNNRQLKYVTPSDLSKEISSPCWWRYFLILHEPGKNITAGLCVHHFIIKVKRNFQNKSINSCHIIGCSTKIENDNQIKKPTIFTHTLQTHITKSK